FDVLFNVGRETLQNDVQNTARFSGFHHVHVQTVKHFWRAAHGGRKGCAAFHHRSRVDQHFLEKLVFLLAAQNFQALHQRETSVDHHRKLAGEDRQFFGIHAATEGGHVELFALLRHLGGGNLLAL